MKIYDLKREARSKKQGFKYLVHIDCYRIKSPNDLLHLGMKDILKDRDAIVLIEWADRIKKLLSRDAVWLQFKHGKEHHERRIIIRPNR